PRLRTTGESTRRAWPPPQALLSPITPGPTTAVTFTALNTFLVRTAFTILTLDVMFHWCLHIGRQALVQTPRSAEMPADRKGLILGNLAYPCAEFSRY